METLSPQVQSALGEVQRYLHDEITPPQAAEAVAMLLARPPEVLMQTLGSWSVEQNRAQPAVPLSEFLLYALQKIYVLGKLNYLDEAAVSNYLDRATSLGLRISPAEEGESFRKGMTEMRISQRTVPITPRARLPKPAAPNLPMQAAPLGEEALNARRLSLILDRIRTQSQSGGQITQADPEAAAHILTMAASTSRTGGEFNQLIEQIRPMIGGHEGNVFIILGGGLPSWDMPDLAPGGAQRTPVHIGAMEKIIDLAEDQENVVTRLRELVIAAVGKFNDGGLAATLWMLHVAEQTIAERHVDPKIVEQIRTEALEKMNAGQLRNYAENEKKRPALRMVLEFFPAMRLPSLFQQLRGEARAERRRSLLGLIEIHEDAGRQYALSELEGELSRPDVDTYYLRNMIYLLHRIPRKNEDDIQRELAALANATARGQNIYVIKEGAVALGQIRTEESVKVLTTRLAEVELALLRGESSGQPVGEMQKTLDRIVGSIARIGTPAALLTVARHGMKANPLLGDTRERLAVLAQYDLSFDEATVSTLLKAIRDEVPGKFLGRFVPKKQDSTVKLIQALTSTRSEEVEEMLGDLAERFSDQEIGRCAAQILAKRGHQQRPAKEEAVATLAGELEFFGLPAVMQSLADMRASGMLTLSTREGQVAAKIAVREGRFLDAQKGTLRSTDAFYDIVERPITGRFAFLPTSPERLQSPNTPLDILSILFEAVRRHDELQLLTTVVPDALSLTKTAVKPTPQPDEKDPSFVREVWIRASSGTPIGQWEREVAGDAYRIRRQVAHWLETGALAAAAPA